MLGCARHSHNELNDRLLYLVSSEREEGSFAIMEQALDYASYMMCDRPYYVECIMFDIYLG